MRKLGEHPPVTSGRKLGEPSYVPPSPIDHPPHYCLGSVEVIDAIEAWQLGFHAGNVVKYVARAEHKGKPVEDLKKARWYLDRLIARLEQVPEASHA